MIVKELLKDNPNLVRTYSDANFYIFGGFPEAYYEEAIDPVELEREYVETDIPIEHEEEDPEEEQEK